MGREDAAQVQGELAWLRPQRLCLHMAPEG